MASSTSPGSMPARCGRRAAGDFGRHDAGAALDPQHAVFDFVRRRALGDVRDAHDQQQQRGHDRQNGARPLAPARAGAVNDAGSASRSIEHRRVRGPAQLSKRHTTRLESSLRPNLLMSTRVDTVFERQSDRLESKAFERAIQYYRIADV